jgi:hypothetical protein
VTRLFCLFARAGLAAVLALLVWTVSSWGPVRGMSPLPVRGLPLAGAAVLLAVGAALTGKPRRAGRVRVVLVALCGALLALATVVALRPRAGLAAVVTDSHGATVESAPGPIEIQARDFSDRLSSGRLALVRWAGSLRLPTTAVYQLRAEGRGRVIVRLDDREVLVAEGEVLKGQETVALTEGSHDLEVTLEPHGPGARLRLGWTRPGLFGQRDEDPIPPRFLGPPIAAVWWWVGDALVVVLGALVALLCLAIPWEAPKGLPAPSPVTARELVASAAGHALVLALMSWPLVTDLAHLGVTDRPDGRLNAWILAWDAHALFHHPSQLFAAPICHPLPDALAFSENLLLPGVLGAPAALAGQPVLAYNLVLLAMLLGSGLATQLLVRRVSGDRLAAFVAGVLFAAGAHRWVRLAHLHAQVTLFLPLTLLALDRFWERRSLRRGLLVGLFLALQGLCSVYLGAITASVVAVALGLMVLGGLRRRPLLHLLAGLALAAALLAPVVAPYLRMRAFQGTEFTITTVAAYAATPESWLASGTRLWGGVTRRQLEPDRVRDTVFPGLIPIVLGIVGLTAAPRRFKALAVAASVVAFFLSLGPETAAYRFLHEQLILVRGLRALARFSLVPVLALSVLAGLALSGRRRAWLLLALALALFESSNVPLVYGRYQGPPAYARWLAGRSGAVAVLPLGERDTDVMLDGVAHFRPLLNGDSGFVPRPYTRAMELLDGPLGEEGLRFLRAVGVRDVVSRRDLGLPTTAVVDGERISEVPQGVAAAVVGRGKPVPTRWTKEGAVLDLGQVESLSGVSFEQSDDPWLSTPELWVSLDGQTWERVPASASLADATLSLYRDPRAARGRVVFDARKVRLLRLDPRLPARPDALEILP